MAAERDLCAELKSLGARAERVGSAHFRFRDVMPALGAEPVSEHSGTVDFRRRSYDGGDQRVVDGVVYARDGDRGWTRFELGRQEPIGPTWLLALLTGTTSADVPASPNSQEGERELKATADVSLARKATGRELDSIGGASQRSLRAIPVSVTIDRDGLPRSVVARIPDHVVSCDYWQYGVETSIAAPPEADALRGPSSIGMALLPLRNAIHRVHSGRHDQ